MDSGDTLSLHVELREGEVADLEEAASSAIAWVQALRAAVQAVDPNANIRIGLVAAEEGSLTWNTVVGWVEDHIEPQLARFERGSARMPRVKKLAFALAVFLIFTAGPAYLQYFGDSFTDADRAMVKEIVGKVRHDRAAEAARHRFFQSLERQPAVTAVSIREQPKGSPIATIPSDQFAEAGGLWVPESEEVVQEQVTYPVLSVVLVRPALTHSPRAWTFKPDGLPEFEATMRDPLVLEAIKSENGLPIRFREGVAMTIKLEVREAWADGEWKLVRGGRSVIQVLTPKTD